MKGCFVGSGSDGMQEIEIRDAILELVNKKNKDNNNDIINILYIGTATYDIPKYKYNQTIRFVELGCIINEIKTINNNELTSNEDIKNYFNICDIIIISGGNTLFAIDKWISIGLNKYLKEAADRGVVLAGGSAGAVCWFDGGHSDSADPDTFKTIMLNNNKINNKKDESYIINNNENNNIIKDWKYIRVPGLGFFPGLICPHADKIQSNGILRSIDFDNMLLKHYYERGICIDHYAALVINNDNYNVISIKNKSGSVLNDKSYSINQSGIPGIWIKDVINNKIVTTLLNSNGKLIDLLKIPHEIIQDTRLEQCRINNPI